MVNFPKLRKELQAYEEHRERMIRKSRDIIKLSKQIIYAVHRDEMKNAAELMNRIEDEKRIINEIARHDKKLICEGSFKVAIQEYVEAALYYSFVKTGKLVNLSVLPGHFILGLTDLTGEMVRRAVFLAGKGEVKKVIKIKDEVDMIYGQMLKFDFRDNETRRKVDAVKYDLRKLEDLVLDLNLKKR